MWGPYNMLNLKIYCKPLFDLRHLPILTSILANSHWQFCTITFSSMNYFKFETPSFGTCQIMYNLTQCPNGNNIKQLAMKCFHRYSNENNGENFKKN